MTSFLEKGCYGPLIQKVQIKLNLDTDGIMGPNTIQAIDTAAPRNKTVEDSNKVSLDQITKILGYPVDLFNRCLNLTGALEGTLYNRCVGNFDGAGLTVGVIGFNIGAGSLQELINHYIRGMDKDNLMFLEKNEYDMLVEMSNLSKRHASILPKTPSDLHRSLFQTLMGDPWWVRAQDELAYKYFDKAVDFLKSFDTLTNYFWTADNYANVFDAVVQTWKPVSHKKWLQDNCRANVFHQDFKAAFDIIYDSDNRWKADVLARRDLFITGKHEHRKVYLSKWGF